MTLVGLGAISIHFTISDLSGSSHFSACFGRWDRRGINDWMLPSMAFSASRPSSTNDAKTAEDLSLRRITPLVIQRLRTWDVPCTWFP